MSTKNIKYNVKLFPLYKAVSWDLLFYYSISFIFLTHVKGITAAEVLFSDAFYPISKILFQIPIDILINNIGKRKSIILGNLLLCICILTTIFANSLLIIIISQVLCALGYCLKNATETNLLYDSISDSPKRNNLFSKIDSRGSALYYYFDAITSIAAGFLFIVNGYLPMFLCLALCLVSVFLSFKFNEPISLKKQKKNLIKTNLFDLKQAFHFIFRSNRLKSLILINVLLSTLFAIFSTLRSSLFTDIGLHEQYFGIIYAILQIISGISTQNQERFHNRFRNKTLSFFSLTTTISMIIIGFCEIFGFSFGISLEIILLMLAVQFIMKGPFYTLIKRYLNSFSTPSMRTKISVASEFFTGIFRAIITFLASFLLGIVTTSYVYVILGCIFTVIFVILLNYMSSRVGLRPEQYSKKEIIFEELH